MHQAEKERGKIQSRVQNPTNNLNNNYCKSYRLLFGEVVLKSETEKFTDCSDVIIKPMGQRKYKVSIDMLAGKLYEVSVEKSLCLF